MAILPVQKISMVMQKASVEDVLAALQEAGLMHISKVASTGDDEILAKGIGEKRMMLADVDSAIDLLKAHQGSPTAIPPRAVPPDELLAIASDIRRRHEALEKAIDELKADIDFFMPFGDFSKDASALSSAGISLKLATLGDDDLLALRDMPVYCQVMASDGEAHSVVIASLGEAALPFSARDLPKKSLSKMRQELSERQHALSGIEEEAARWSYQLRVLEALREEEALRLDRLIEMKKMGAYGELAGFSGFVLQKDIESFMAVMAKHLVAIRVERPVGMRDVPVRLKNPEAISGFETIVRSFTGINYFETDKTALVFMLFTLFGGLCLMDAGYGLLLFLSGYVLAIKRDRDLGQVFMWTGAFTFLLGLLCGQVFGLMFAKDIMLTTAPLLPLASDAMSAFKFSLLVGLLAMLLTNMVAIYQNGIRTHALGCLLAVLGGLVLSSYHSGLWAGVFDPQGTSIAAMVFFGFSLSSWLLFPEPVFGQRKHLANALWMLYAGPIGLLQDVLSHMRLFGIALSGSILAMVINRICSVLPAPLGMAFAPLGHAIVFVLSLLSLYIHTNRLIFLEFGSKCMGGGDLYFKPFVRRTLR